MKISIITVTYNSAKYLQDCIDSVRKQNYSNIEHIIIDGDSTDNTINIIRNNSKNIAYWVSEVDKGMYHAINKGMNLASGDIVGILNSDDVLASADVISAIAESFKKNKIDSLYGDLVYVAPENTQKVLRFWKGLPYKRSRFTYGWMPAHPTFYLRRGLIAQYGGYESHYFTAADYEFMARYLYHYRISSMYLPKLIVKMRNGGQSNESLSRRLRANRRDYLAMKKNNIPFPLIVSILKPLIKIPQYSSTLVHKVLKNNKAKYFINPVSCFPVDGL